ncbi:MAG: ATP-binding cassette subfamily B protein [Saprospiraceae bacterium]|jgi:ATP-binding cassette subfamily B protein
MKGFTFYKQLDSMDCGPTCLRMVSKHYGKSYSLPFLREKCYIDRAGVSLKGISEAAELIGFRTLAVNIPLTGKKDAPSLSTAPLPVILHWNQNHFVALYKLSEKYAWIADPADGKHKVPISLLQKAWFSSGEQGIALLLETTPEFYQVWR